MACRARSNVGMSASVSVAAMACSVSGPICGSPAVDSSENAGKSSTASTGVRPACRPSMMVAIVSRFIASSNKNFFKSGHKIEFWVFGITQFAPKTPMCNQNNRECNPFSSISTVNSHSKNPELDFVTKKSEILVIGPGSAARSTPDCPNRPSECESYGRRPRSCGPRRWRAALRGR